MLFRSRAVTIFKRFMTMTQESYGIAKNGATMKVELTEKESNICNVLQGVSAFIAKERPELPVIESRIAGGWVRDKVHLIKATIFN